MQQTDRNQNKTHFKTEEIQNFIRIQLNYKLSGISIVLQAATFIG